MEGTWNDGKDESSSPYTLPIVFTGSFAKYTIAVVVIIATREPGILSVILGHMSIITTAAIPMREAERFIVFMFLWEGRAWAALRPDVAGERGAQGELG